MTDRKISVKNAIKSSDFRPKLLTAIQDEGVRELLLGRRVGEVVAIHYQADPKDATVIQEGLQGVFRFTPAEGIEGDTLQASRLWIPDSAADLYRPSLREAEGGTDAETGEVTPRRKISMVVALDVYAIRSSAALGYTWKFTPVIQPKVNDAADPFTRISSELAALVIEDKSGDKAEASKAKAGKAA